MIVDYQWDFGDGATSSGFVGQHNYSTPGTYAVTLTITDDDGGVFALVDALTLLNWAFADDSEPICIDAADIDDNGSISINVS